MNSQGGQPFRDELVKLLLEDEADEGALEREDNEAKKRVHELRHHVDVGACFAGALKKLEVLQCAGHKLKRVLP